MTTFTCEEVRLCPASCMPHCTASRSICKSQPISKHSDLTFHEHVSRTANVALANPHVYPSVVMLNVGLYKRCKCLREAVNWGKKETTSIGERIASFDRNPSIESILLLQLQTYQGTVSSICRSHIFTRYQDIAGRPM